MHSFSYFLLTCLLWNFAAYPATPQRAADRVDQMYRSALRQSSSDSIRDLAKQMARLSENSGLEYGRMQAKLLFAYCFWDQYELDSAKMLLDECLEYFGHMDPYPGMDHGRSLLYSGMVHMRKGDLDKALVCGQQSLKIFREMGDHIYEGKSLNLLGSVEHTLTNFPKSLEYYAAAYQAKLDGGADMSECISELSNISQAYQRMGQYEKALTYAHKSLGLSSQAGNANSQINTLNSLGAIHAANQTLDSAIFYYRRCKEVAELHHKQIMIFLSDYNTANAYSNFGRYLESNQMAGRLLEDYQSLPSSLLESAEILMAKNFLKLDQPRQCIRVISPILRRDLEGGNKQVIINLSDMLWRAYQQTGRFDSAFVYLSIHQAYQDSVYNLENQRKLSSLFAQLETLEKQNQINLLTSERELQDAQNKTLVVSLFSGSIIAMLMIISLVLGFRNREKRQRLRNFKLQGEIREKQEDLQLQTLKVIQKENSLERIEQEIKDVSVGKDLRKVLNTIRINKSVEKEWKKFDDYFGNTQRDFLEKVSASFPQLSISEKRLASLIKMELTNSEIADLMNIESKSVRMAKYRLKKKLGLENEESIYRFLSSL